MNNNPIHYASIEALEVRQLLAGFSALRLHGLLDVTGTEQNDVISITLIDTSYHVALGQQSMDFSQYVVKSIKVDAGAGNDDISVRVNRRTTILGGDGDDTIAGKDGVFDGGVGNDRISGGQLLIGGDGNDSLVGGPGDDTLQPGSGNDTLRGGAGIDLADYSGRGLSLHISLDNKANDGGKGEHGNVETDIENILGGYGNDLIIGDDSPNDLNGGLDGADTVKGLGGNDTLYAAIGGADGGTGDDLFTGGVVDYSARAEPFSIDLSRTAPTDPYDYSPTRFSINGTAIGAGEIDHILFPAFNNNSYYYSSLPNHDQFKIIGGKANDTFYYRDDLRGDEHHDYSSFPDIVLDGSAGNDSVTYTGTNPVTLIGGDGSDTLLGGFGKSDLQGGAGNDAMTVRSKVHFDSIGIADYSDHSASVNVTLDGIANDGAIGETDILIGDFRGVIGGSGDDSITGNAKANDLAGGPGNDAILGLDGADKLHGDAGNDQLSGGGGDDLLEGGDGSDALIGGGGNDALFGHDGTDAYDDLPHGMVPDGNDLLSGGAGSDYLDGQNGNDTLIGAAGDDDLAGGKGTDDMSGGAGRDSATYAYRAENLTISLDGVANDGAFGERDFIRGDVEDVYGGLGNDLITGSSADNQLYGSGGNDTIHGGDGNDNIDGDDYNGDGLDVIYGDAGNDRLSGGGRYDRLFGGTGDDYIDAREFALSKEYGSDYVDGGPGTDRATVDPPSIYMDELHSIELKSEQADA